MGGGVGRRRGPAKMIRPAALRQRGPGGGGGAGKPQRPRSALDGTRARARSEGGSGVKMKYTRVVH